MAACNSQTPERSAEDCDVAEISSGPRDFFSYDESRLERKFEERPTRIADKNYGQEEVEDLGPSVTQRLVYDKGDYEDRPKPVPPALLPSSNEDSGIKLASDSTSPDSPYPNGSKPRAYRGRHGTPRRRDPINCYDARWLEQDAEAEESTVLGYSVRCHSPILSGSTDIANFVSRDGVANPLLGKAEDPELYQPPKNEFSAQLAEADKIEKLLKNNRAFNIRAMWSDDSPERNHEIRGEKRPRQISTSEKVVKKIPSRLVLNLAT